MQDANVTTLFDVMDYLYWAHISNLPLMFELTDDDLNWIFASTNSYVWRDHYAYDELFSLPAFEWMKQLSEFADVIGNGADWAAQPYFTEYFDGTVFPKFIFYSGHSETVFPFLQYLGYSY
jgi:hypothetical protein